MSVYWLVPLWEKEGVLRLGADRMALGPERARLSFATELQQLHPRLLLPFKLSLLLSDEELDSCGTEALPFSLEDNGDIVLLREHAAPLEGSVPQGWRLSHCAEAYIDRLPGPSELRPLLEGAQVSPAGEAWLGRMREWVNAGADILVLKEEGS